MKRLLLLAVLNCAALRAPGADASSVEERFRALEARLATVEQENAALRARLGATALGPAAPPYGIVSHNGGSATVGDGVVLPAGRESRVTIGGFTQMQAEFGGTGDSRFAGATDRIYVRRSRLSMIASFAEHFEARVDAEYSSGTMAPASGLRVQANEIYLNWSRFPAANIRAGQLKPAFCQELLAIEYKGPMVERSLGADRLGDFRQTGVSVFGELVPQRLNYAVMVANGNGTNTTVNDNDAFHYTTHVAALAFDDRTAGRLTLGAGALRSRDTAVSRPGFDFDHTAGGAPDQLFTGTRTGWGVDATWRRGLLEVASEWLRMRFAPTNRVPDAHFDGESWQLTAAYYLVPQKFQLAVRREHFDPNLSRRGDSTENWLVGLDYYFKGDDIRVIVDYLFGRAPGLPDNRGRLLTRFQIVY
ncbi:MAG: carbohydrate porin [Verrucomicrobia bacterium]|nr:carbohydrate porin [Verrucomicrobiota bacterium]